MAVVFPPQAIEEPLFDAIFMYKRQMKFIRQMLSDGGLTSARRAGDHDQQGGSHGTQFYLSGQGKSKKGTLQVHISIIIQFNLS